MNIDQIQGNWTQLKGEIKRKWGLLTDDEITAAEGRREILIGRLQERYGLVKEEAHRQFDEFLNNLGTRPATPPEQHLG